MRGIATSIFVLGLVGIAFAQQAPTPPCQAQLAQALQRSITFQQAAAQEREAIALYFQEELKRVTAERDTLMQKHEELLQKMSNTQPQARKE